MKRVLLLAFISFFASINSVSSQYPAWSENVASILYDHCVRCHRAGEIAPFPLLTYEDAYAHQSSIAEQVEARNMPPWPAEEEYCHYLDENVLTQNEIDIINDWVNGGAPEGDPDLAPDPPVFNEGSQLGTPDTVLAFAGHYTHPGDGTDHYWGYVLPSGFLTEKHINAFEFRAGNKALVHHVLIYYDTTGIVASYDATSSEYGFEAASSLPFTPAEFVTLYNPGMNSRFLPPGIAFRVPAGADIVLQVHYAPYSSPATDSSSINIFYSNDDSVRFTSTRFIGEGKLIEPEFFLPANEVKTFHSEYTFKNGDVSLFGISPHMHLLGKSCKFYAVNPFNDTIPLVNIPDWKFNWQLFYNFTSMLKLEDQTKIYGEITYDNTTNNPNNPNNPPLDVAFGYYTYDEMCRYYLNYVSYKEGDEEMILDTNDVATGEIIPGLVSTPQLYPLRPNPASEFINVSFYLPNAESVNISIFDLEGKRISQPWSNKSCKEGLHKTSFNISSLPAGMYLCRVTMNTFTRSKPFVVK